MKSSPRIRVNWIKTVLDLLQKTMTPTAGDRLRANIPARSREAIDKAGIFDWLPAEHYLAILEAAVIALGHKEFELQFRRMMAVTYERPIFRPLIRGALAVFASTPATLAKVIPPGWSLVGDGLGEFTVEPGSNNTGSVYWKKIPAMAIGHKPFIGAWRACVHSFIDVMGRTGDVEVDDSRAAEQMLTFRMRWS